jgi:hypothetical protein
MQQQGIANPNSLLGGMAGMRLQQQHRSVVPMRQLNRGPSKSFQTTIFDDGDVCSDGQAKEKLNELNLVSLRLDEILIGGGLEIGRLKCSMDIWWSEEEEV